MEYEEIKAAVEQISMPADVRKRIGNTDWKRKKQRRKRVMLTRTVTAVCAAFLLFAGAAGRICERRSAAPIWKIRAYAKDKNGTGWTYLKKGQPVQLQKQEDQSYYAVEVEVPDDYSYVQTTITVGDECIHVGTENPSAFQNSETENTENPSVSKNSETENPPVSKNSEPENPSAPQNSETENAAQETASGKTNAACITIIDGGGVKTDEIRLVATEGENGTCYITYASEEEAGSE